MWPWEPPFSIPPPRFPPAAAFLLHPRKVLIGRRPRGKIWPNHLKKVFGGGGHPRGAVEGKGPRRRPQKRVDRRLEEVAKAVGGDYCRLQMPLRLAFGIRGTVAGQRLGALEGRGLAQGLGGWLC